MSESDSEQAGVPLIEDISDSDGPAPTSNGKRKRENDAPAESKRAAKRKKAKKPKDVQDDALDEEKGVNHAIAHMDSSLMADHIAQRTKRFRPDVSVVEAEDLHVPSSAILDTTSNTETRTTDKLPAFLEQFAGPRRSKKGSKLLNAPEAKGSPHTLIVAGGGLRAADLTRALRKFQTKDCMVAKLFAKHIKIKEAIETVKKTRIGVGVGTPQRIIDLLEDGALKPDCIERIVIDASHIDVKKRGILDMKETQVPLVQLLTRSDLKERFGTGEGKIDATAPPVLRPDTLPHTQQVAILMALFTVTTRIMALLHLMMAILLITTPGASALSKCAKGCYDSYSNSKKFHHQHESMQTLCDEDRVPAGLVEYCQVSCFTHGWDFNKDKKPCDYYGSSDAKASEDLKLRDATTVDTANSEAHVDPEIDLRRSTPVRDARQKRRASVLVNKVKVDLSGANADGKPAIADLPPRDNLAQLLDKRMPGDPHPIVNACGPPGETCAGKPGGGTPSKREAEDQGEAARLEASSVVKPGPTLVQRVASQRPAFTFQPTSCTTLGMPCGAGKVKERDAEGEQAASKRQVVSSVMDRSPGRVRSKKPSSHSKATDPDNPKPALCGYPGMTCGAGTGKTIKQRDASISTDTFVDDDGNVFEVEPESRPGA
ncbi:hypothetical protein Q7P37_006539 [Cladosporium fusiforme]